MHTEPTPTADRPAGGRTHRTADNFTLAWKIVYEVSAAAVLRLLPEPPPATNSMKHVLLLLDLVCHSIMCTSITVYKGLAALIVSDSKAMR